MRIGAAVAGANVKMRGRLVWDGRISQLLERGILHVDVPKLELINNIYDGITIATLREYSLVNAGEMVALGQGRALRCAAWRVVVDVEGIANSKRRRYCSVKSVAEQKRVALIVSGTAATRARLLKKLSRACPWRVSRAGAVSLLEPDIHAT